MSPVVIWFNHTLRVQSNQTTFSCQHSPGSTKISSQTVFVLSDFKVKLRSCIMEESILFRTMIESLLKNESNQFSD